MAQSLAAGSLGEGKLMSQSWVKSLNLDVFWEFVGKNLLYWHSRLFENPIRIFHK